MPPGLSKKEKAQWAEGKPPGWRKGKKTGWGGSDIPPGLQKKNKKNIEKWKKERAEASEKAETLIRNRDRDKDSETIENNAQRVSLSVNETVNAGVPADQVVTLVQKAIGKDMSGEDIEQVTRAVAHGVSQGSDAEAVVRHAEKVLDGNVKGEDVALSIYRWVEKKTADRK